MRTALSRALAGFAASAILCGLGVGSAAAVPGPPHVIAVPPDIGVGRVMVLRPHRLDLFDGGLFKRSVYLNGQAATLSGLADAVGDPAFMSRPAQGTLSVNAALLQRPQTNLIVGGAGLHTVELRADPRSPVFLAGTSSRVSFTDVTVTGATSLARASRPYVSYGGRSAVSASTSRFTSLGRSGGHPIAALQLGRGATLTASNVSFIDNVIGLKASSSAGVRLSVITASGSSQDGIVLRNAGSVSARNVTLRGNRRDGLVLAGIGTRVTGTGGFAAIGNRRFGIMVTSAVTAAIRDPRTHSNGVAGINVHDAGVSSVVGQVSAQEPVALRVDSAAKFTADDITATSDRVGITATEKSHNLQLRTIAVSGARTGVRIDADNVVANNVTVTGSGTGIQVASPAKNVRINKLTVTSRAHIDQATIGAVVSGTGTTLTDSRIDGARIGVDIRGPETTISGGAISAIRTAVAVHERADGTAVTGVTIKGGDLGVSVATGRVALLRDVISDSGRAALRTAGGSTTVTSSTLSSMGSAVSGYAPVSVTDSTLTGAVGAHIAAGVVARFSDSQINGSRTGIRVVKGGQVRVINSNVAGHTPIRGIATVLGLSFIGPLPLHWLGAAGLSLLVIALLLVALSRSREGGHERLVLAPAHVTNRR